jgi:uncharacterized protein (DUF1697 family)
MTAYVALLRAVNVGGRKLLMADLKAIAEELGLGSPRTFIASGNLLFTSGDSEKALKAALEKAIGAHMGAEVPVMIRAVHELFDVEAQNPFPAHPGNRLLAIFLDEAPAADAIERARDVADEKLALGRREIYVAYADRMAMARSKLKLPAAAGGTARNMNSVAKMAALLQEME